MVCFGGLYHLKLIKGCLPQILLGLFLDTWIRIFSLKAYFLIFHPAVFRSSDLATRKRYVNLVENARDNNADVKYVL